MNYQFESNISENIEIPDQYILQYLLSDYFSNLKDLIKEEIEICESSLKANETNPTYIKEFNLKTTIEIEKQLSKLKLLKQIMEI